jgi:hypothetical protein
MRVDGLVAVRESVTVTIVAKMVSVIARALYKIPGRTWPGGMEHE